MISSTEDNYKVSIERLNNFKQWYENNKDNYKKAADYVKKQICFTLKEHNIIPAYIKSRTKDANSAYDKAKKYEIKNGERTLKYTDPKNQIMDFAGVRVVLYLPFELEAVINIFENLFKDDILEKESENKLDKLGKNTVGYLSVHYVLKLNPKEAIYRELKGLKCEVQIRTILEDAWAQIFHDRLYKNYYLTNPKAERQVNLLSGSLELIDDKINDLASFFDSMNGNINAREFQYLLDETINADNLVKYFNILFKTKSYRLFSFDQTIEILSHFDISTLRDLDRYITPDFINKIEVSDIDINIDRVIRYILIIQDYTKFFDNLNHTFTIDSSTYNFLNGYIDMKTVCEKYNQLNYILKEEK